MSCGNQYRKRTSSCFSHTPSQCISSNVHLPLAQSHTPVACWSLTRLHSKEGGECIDSSGTADFIILTVEALGMCKVIKVLLFPTKWVYKDLVCRGKFEVPAHQPASTNQPTNRFLDSDQMNHTQGKKLNARSAASLLNHNIVSSCFSNFSNSGDAKTFLAVKIFQKSHRTK